MTPATDLNTRGHKVLRTLDKTSISSSLEKCGCALAQEAELDGVLRFHPALNFYKTQVEKNLRFHKQPVTVRNILQ